MNVLVILSRDEQNINDEQLCYERETKKMQNCKSMGEQKIAIGDHPFQEKKVGS